MNFLRIHPSDNVLIALQTIPVGTRIKGENFDFTCQEQLPQKHKFAMRDLPVDSPIIMYGITVGKVVQAIAQGELVTIANVEHYATPYVNRNSGSLPWQAPDTTAWQRSTFQGFHREDGQVGTRNYWLVVPLVFCENRNVKVLEALFMEALAIKPTSASMDLRSLVDAYKNGASESEILQTELPVISAREHQRIKLFPNLDGIRFLTHDGGCGGTREDATMLCRLLASYIAHPNVAGATVLSLGCQNAQIAFLKEALQQKDPHQTKPVFYLEQQGSASDHVFVAAAAKQTFVGCMRANKINRQPAPLSKLILGLECGGSDGFSGISANPTLGQTSDLLVALGASVILAEFPELHGVEQELINRCTSKKLADRFMELMKSYADRARAVGTHFSWNPSPGNIRDGLITDAMKSAGAAKKGGSSPITGVLDYTASLENTGLNLLCTPGNDVESTTALAGSGANLIAFTTGLGTPTGNPIAPTIKISSNSALAENRRDMIDFDCGGIIRGKQTISQLGSQLLDLLIKTASGDYLTKAERLGQHDFIPWKRGISL